jgi:hypothetical protein
MLRNLSKDRPLGYQQIIGAVAATALTVPAGSVYCIIQTEAQALRWRDDGVNPTAAIGYPLAVGNELVYTGQLDAFRLIQIAATATINICYYGAPL